MLRAYFDDSGTDNGQPVLTWGGLVGTESQFEQLETEWLELLHQPFPGKRPLRSFHLVDCRWGQKHFIDYSIAERDRLRLLFRDIVVRSGVHAVSCSIDVRAHNRHVRYWAASLLGTPNLLCFAGVVDFAHALRRAHYREHDGIAFTFDRGQPADPMQRRFDRGGFWKIARPEDTIAFGCVAEHAALQAADTIATESFWHVKDIIEFGEEAAVEKPHFIDLCERLSFQLNWLDEGAILEGLKKNNLG